MGREYKHILDEMEIKMTQISKVGDEANKT